MKLIDIKEDRIKVLGRGGKVRILFLVPSVITALESYLEARGSDTCEYLFVNRIRKSCRNHLSHSGLKNIINTYAKKA